MTQDSVIRAKIVFSSDLNPNELTQDTLRKSARGEEVHRAKDAADLFDRLGI
jgi:DNA-damage-inducible protein J